MASDPGLPGPSYGHTPRQEGGNVIDTWQPGAPLTDW